MAPLIEFSFQLTEEDIAFASDALSLRWRQCLLPGIATTLVGVVGGIAVIVLAPDWAGIEPAQWLGTDFAVIATGLMLTCCGTLWPKLHRWVRIRHFRRNPTAQNKVSYQLFDDYITATSELCRSEVRWQGFLKAEEKSGHLFLFTSPMGGYIIPLAYLTTSQASQLREVVSKRIQIPRASRSFLRRRI